MDCNKMSYAKCRDCPFFMDVRSTDRLEYLCQITSNILVLNNCIHCDDVGEGCQ